MNTRTSPSPPHAEFFPPPRAPRAPARWLAGIVDDYRQVLRFWPVIQNMVQQDLRVRYHRSFLGFLWTLVNPILMMVTLTVVFSTVLGVEDWRRYAVYLFAGMVPWNFLNATLNDSAFCIIHNEGLIRKIYLPKLVFPLSRLLINLVTLVLSMVAMFLLLVPMGNARFSLPMVTLPLLLVLFSVFALGLGLVVAVLNTFYRDCGHLVQVFLQAWYFASAIIYYPTQIPESVRWRLWLNPAYPFIKMFHDVICDGRWPNPITLLAAAGIAAASLGVGYAAFKSHEDKLVFRL